MTSAEIVRKTIAFEHPERLAFDYYAYGRRYTDIITTYLDWDFEYEHKSWVEGDFEYYLDAYGNTWRRSSGDQSSKGQIYRGVLEESWGKLDSFALPNFSVAANTHKVRNYFNRHPDLYKVGCLYIGSFEILRMLRGFQNLMEDLLLEPERIQQLCGMIDKELISVVEGYAKCGANGIHIMEDWGTQNNALISRRLWEKFFAPGYYKICETAHRHNMTVMLHSCGMLRELIDGIIDSGVDVLQFDQNANYSSPERNDGIERLRADYGGRVTFFCPVDIQHTLVKGDKKNIESEVKRLVGHLGSRDGGFIAKSYGRGTKVYLDSIGCDPDWNNFAFECFKKYGEELFKVEFNIPIIS